MIKKLSIIIFLCIFTVIPIVSGAEGLDAQNEATFLKTINAFMFKALFFDLAGGKIYVDGNPDAIPIPFLVALLILGAIFFTFWYGWMNIRGFKHSIDIVRGKFDNPNDSGELSHFRALTSALSATIGLGNIAGVAIAIQLGGPGAVFWMLFAAFFGMSSKFSECTLSQIFRKINPDGSVSGGPMYYLDLGFKKMGGLWGPFGKILAITFAVMVMGGAVGGGNMFQANQSLEAVATLANSHGIGSFFSEKVELFNTTFVIGNWVFGVGLAFMVGLVIIGGIKWIGATTARIVPLMCGIYVTACLFIIFTHYTEIPSAINLIFTMAFHQNSMYGGFVGVLIWGVQRASFSNEAGLGSSAIVHAAAKTEEPVREGLVAMMEPFVDTIIVCLMTALVVIITGAWNDPSIPQKAGVALTSAAFATSLNWFPYILTISILLFAYSTMISWCYYGEKGWCYLLDHFGKGTGLKTVVVFRLAFVVAVVVGTVHPLKDVLNFSDAMILSMAFPNILGSIILAPMARRVVKDYWKRYKNGEMRMNNSPPL